MVGATSYAISGSGLNKLFVTAEVSEESLLAKAPQKRLMSFLLRGLRSPMNSFLIGNNK